MSINQTTQSINSGHVNGAQEIPSLVLLSHQFRELDEKVDRLMRFRGTKPAAMCLVGGIGTGKTHYAIKKQEQLSRDIVNYGSYKTMPVLIVRTPKTPTNKNLVERMLHELKDTNPSCGTLEQKEKRLVSLIEKLEVRLIVIDEIQEFLPKTVNGSPSKAIAWLKSFMDETVTPILFMGTERAELLHKIDMELASRIYYSAKLK